MSENRYEIRIENDLLKEEPEERLLAAKRKLDSYLEEWRHRFTHEAPSEAYTSAEGRTAITSNSLQEVSVEHTKPDGARITYEYDGTSNLSPIIASYEQAGQQIAGKQPDPIQSYEALSWILFTANRSEAEGR